MSGERILFVEDDSDLPLLLRDHLAEHGFVLEHAGDGPTGLQMIRESTYALALLDIDLPGIGGLEIARTLRAENNRIPILMLTSKVQEIEKIAGLNAGADDYVTKPFSVGELVARIRALLRRADQLHAVVPQSVMTFGTLTIDTNAHVVSISGTVIELTPMEFQLLVYLASHAERAVSRDEILRNVWGSAADYSMSVNSLVSRMRKKLQINSEVGDFIETVRGYGYKFVPHSSAGKR